MVNGGLPPYSEFVKPRILLEKLLDFKPIIMDQSNLDIYENYLHFEGYVPDAIKFKQVDHNFHQLLEKFLSLDYFQRPVCEILLSQEYSSKFYDCSILSELSKPEISVYPRDYNLKILKNLEPQPGEKFYELKKLVPLLLQPVEPAFTV